MSTFLPVYAALRLTGPRRPSLFGMAVRGLILVAVSPLILLAVLVRVLVQAIAYRRRLTRAEATLRRNIAAYEARQAKLAGLSPFERSVAELRRLQGEDGP